MNREKQRIELIQHVKKHYFINKVDKNNWEIGCWLGKEPTGRLFKMKYLGMLKYGEQLTQLANDMWDFLYTEKGEDIIKKEYNS